MFVIKLLFWAGICQFVLVLFVYQFMVRLIMKNRLENYFQLVNRVDELCRNVEEVLREHIKCAAGCSSCCKAITLFPVEAAAIRMGVEALPEEEAEIVRRHAAEGGEGDTCPLLYDHRCLIYPFRPIICRTHGLPILFTDDGKRRVDYCPSNLQGCKSLPGSAVIDLDRLNALLVAVNSLFLSGDDSAADPAERVSIARAVRGLK
jgi:Fe-S-cluster containining protein